MTWRDVIFQISLPSRDGTKIITCPFFKKMSLGPLCPCCLQKNMTICSTVTVPLSFATSLFAEQKSARRRWKSYKLGCSIWKLNWMNWTLRLGVVISGGRKFLPPGPDMGICWWPTMSSRFIDSLNKAGYFWWEDDILEGAGPLRYLFGDSKWWRVLKDGSTLFPQEDYSHRPPML